MRTLPFPYRLTSSRTRSRPLSPWLFEVVTVAEPREIHKGGNEDARAHRGGKPLRPARGRGRAARARGQASELAYEIRRSILSPPLIPRARGECTGDLRSLTCPADRRPIPGWAVWMSLIKAKFMGYAAGSEAWRAGSSRWLTSVSGDRRSSPARRRRGAEEGDRRQEGREEREGSHGLDVISTKADRTRPSNGRKARQECGFPVVSLEETRHRALCAHGPASSEKEKAQERVLGSQIIPRRRPTLPRGLPRSTIGAEGLNCRVRNGNGCGPFARITGKTSYSFPSHQEKSVRKVVGGRDQGQALGPDTWYLTPARFAS